MATASNPGHPMNCPACPCPVTCLRWAAFCEWAAEEPPDPVKLAHIRNRSAMGPSPPAAPPAPAVPGVPLAESMALVARMNACPHRSTEGCGCGGGKCAARDGAMVTHLGCFDCLRAADVTAPPGSPARPG